MLEADNTPLVLLRKSSRFDKYSDIRCWKKNQGGMLINIFTIIFEDESKLNNLWEEINNDIGFYFQSTIDNEASRWNLYIFFFIKRNVSSIIKYVIEQDKYCARKIVVENFKDDVPIDKYIENRLFNIKIKQKEESESKTEKESLIEIISNSDNKLVNIIKENEDVNEIVKKYLEE